MMFSGMDEYQFAKFFVVAKQEQIGQKLEIKHLYMDMVIQTVYKFIIKNKKSILSKFANQYDSLYDKKFFNNIIFVLKDAKQRGIPLQNDMF